MQSVASCLKRGTEFLEEKHLSEAQISAETLLSHVLRKPRSLFWLEEGPISFSYEHEFFRLLEKRAERYPLQYLLKTVPFRNAMLWVGEGCLIPRPETESLVEIALREIRSTASVHVLDIGTGSGNIAVSIAQERPSWQVTAADISERALGFARANAAENGARNRVHFVCTDLWQGVARGSFDVMVSNPPYLTWEDLRNLQAEIRFEPIEALDGGSDGLLFYRRIIGGAHSVLKPGGMIFFEVGLGQAQRVAELLCLHKFQDVRIEHDDAGVDRFAWGRLKSYG